MELHNFLNELFAKKNKVLAIIAIFIGLGLIFSLAQPLKYCSTVKLLVVQKQIPGNNSDAYAMMRSSEYIGKILSKVANSTSFAEKVFLVSNDIDRSYFGDDTKKLSKKWGNTIETKTLNETGIIEVSAYHTNKIQAEKIVRSISAIMIANHAEYHGLNDAVEIKLLDKPITTNYPVKPNLAVNVVLAFFAGLFISLAWIYLKLNNNNNNYNHNDYRSNFDLFEESCSQVGGAMDFEQKVAYPGADNSDNARQSLSLSDEVANRLLNHRF